jgi:Short C-terminal domain
MLQISQPAYRASVLRPLRRRPGAVSHMQRWRGLAVWVLIVAATMMLFVGCLTVWVRRQALDTGDVVNASGQLLEDPKIREAVSVYLVAELYRYVDVQGEIRGLLPQQMQGFAGPLSAALDQAAPRVAYDLLGTPPVVAFWESSVRVAHGAFRRIVNGDPGAERAVYLGLRPLLLELAARLGVEPEVASKLPADAGQLALFRSDQLGKLRQGIRLLKAVSIYFLLVVVALYGFALWLARGERRKTLLWMGLAVLVTGVAILLARSLVGTAVIDSLAGSQPLIKPAANDGWYVLTGLLSSIAWTAIEMGLVGIGLALLAGPSVPATAARRLLAPGLVRYPLVAWSAVTLVIVAVFLTIPIVDTTRLITRCVLIALLIGGTLMVQRVAQAEHPDGGWRFELEGHLPHPGREANKLGSLERLAALRDRGVLSDREFAAEKAEILGESPPAAIVDSG